jgi:hypothetical protein
MREACAKVYPSLLKVLFGGLRKNKAGDTAPKKNNGFLAKINHRAEIN